MKVNIEIKGTKITLSELPNKFTGINVFEVPDKSLYEMLKRLMPNLIE